MAYNFKNLSDVEIMEAVNDSANILVEVDGDIKRTPKTSIGTVKSVNGVEPDESGDIGLDIPHEVIANEVITNETILTSEDKWTNDIPVAPGKLIGESYTVIWDGVEYVCPLNLSGGDPYSFGNRNIYDPNAASTGEPFYCTLTPVNEDWNTGTNMHFYSTQPGNHVITVIGPVQSIKLLDSKFIGEDIARTADTVKTVNGNAPDENGDVTIDVPECKVKSVNGVTPDENGDIQIAIDGDNVITQGKLDEAISEVEGKIPTHDWDSLEGKPFGLQEVAATILDDTISFVEDSVGGVVGHFNPTGELFPIVEGATFHIEGVLTDIDSGESEEMSSDGISTGLYIQFQTNMLGRINISVSDNKYLVRCQGWGSYTLTLKVIYTVNTIVTLDSAYVGSDIARVDHTHEWDEIENKPFGEVEKLNLVDDITFCRLYIGEKYVVRYNGVEYEVIGEKGPEFNGLVDVTLGTHNPTMDDEYPFYIRYSAEGDTTLVFEAAGGDGPLELYTISSSIQELDSKYIGDDIARVSDIPSIPETTWESLPDKPFGEIEQLTLLFDGEQQYGDVLYNTRFYNGTNYLVVYNDVKYIVTGEQDEGGVAIGSWDLPFKFVYNHESDKTTVWNGSSVYMKVYEIESITKTLDPTHLPTTVPVIPTANVGDTIKVKAVDENGVPTEWEAVPVGDSGENQLRVRFMDALTYNDSDGEQRTLSCDKSYAEVRDAFLNCRPLTVELISTDNGNVTFLFTGLSCIKGNDYMLFTFDNINYEDAHIEGLKLNSDDTVTYEYEE